MCEYSIYIYLYNNNYIENAHIVTYICIYVCANMFVRRSFILHTCSITGVCLSRFIRVRPEMSNVLEHLLHFQHFQQFISARLASANSDSRVVYRDLFDDEVQALEDGEEAADAVTINTCVQCMYGVFIYSIYYIQYSIM